MHHPILEIAKDCAAIPGCDQWQDIGIAEAFGPVIPPGYGSNGRNDTIKASLNAEPFKNVGVAVRLNTEQIAAFAVFRPTFGLHHQLVILSHRLGMGKHRRLDARR